MNLLHFYRVPALSAYQILDTPHEALYDTFVHIAAQMAGVRMNATRIGSSDNR